VDIEAVACVHKIVTLRYVNIYVHNIPSCSNSPTLQFADDITHSEAGSAHELQLLIDKLTDSFNQTKSFCDSNDLIINTDKTQLIVFKSSRKALPADFQLVLDGHCIKPVTEVKLLGVALDHHFTFKQHITNTVLKCNGLLDSLARAAPHLSQDLLKLTYTALVRSRMEYASAIFASCAPTHLKKLEVVQKVAARIICHAPKLTHAAPLLESLELETMESRRADHIRTLVESFLSGNCHPAMRDIFIRKQDGAFETIDPQNSRTVIGKKRFSAFAIKTLNKI